MTLSPKLRVYDTFFNWHSIRYRQLMPRTDTDTYRLLILALGIAIALVVAFFLISVREPDSQARLNDLIPTIDWFSLAEGVVRVAFFRLKL